MENSSSWYKITKIEGVNNDKYPIGFIMEGRSRGLIYNSPFCIGRMNHWFTTSRVNKIEYDTENSGTFYTDNSTYKFEIVPQ